MMKDRGLFIWIVCLLVLAVLPINAQIIKVTIPTQSLRTGERLDIEVSLHGQWENPYRQEEAKLNIIFVAPH